jgi:hypothetical protein
MITEDYVSFETAKLLKEKGFGIKEETRGYYPIKGDATGRLMFGAEYHHNTSQVQIAAPTLQMAIKWLMKNHNICIVSLPVVTDDDGEAGCLWNCVISKKLKTLHNSDGLYESSESALSNGLKYVLENLI